MNKDYAVELECADCFLEKIDREIKPIPTGLITKNPAVIIPFLESKPEKNDFLNRGIHLKHRTNVLLKLFGKHVFSGADGEKSPTGNAVIGGIYEAIDEMVFDGPGIVQALVEGAKKVKSLTQFIEQDRRILIENGLNPCKPIDHFLTKQWWCKLQRSLAENVKYLQGSINFSFLIHDVTNNEFENEQRRIMIAAGQARLLQAQTAVEKIYDQMVSPLVEKLRLRGFGDSGLPLFCVYGYDRTQLETNLVSLKIVCPKCDREQAGRITQSTLKRGVKKLPSECTWCK